MAEDVVQEAMLRASRALLRDDRHMDLKPWLYRLTRNCALDELARARTDSVELDVADATGRLRASDFRRSRHRLRAPPSTREVLADLAGLPEQQRHALVRREVDGITHAQLAGELQMSVEATKSLVYRPAPAWPSSARRAPRPAPTSRRPSCAPPTSSAGRRPPPCATSATAATAASSARA
jgi:RNA polymerase sigma factor (sigma-70 family)